jgi:ubiquitin-like modifier-activating enzyme ATG7
MSTIKFAPWQSDIDVQFYAALAHIKINHDKLDDSARKLLGLYDVRAADHPSRSTRIQIHPNALTSDELVSPSLYGCASSADEDHFNSTPPNYCRAEGIIKNCNTIEDFKNLDRTAILETAARTVRSARQK